MNRAGNSEIRPLKVSTYTSAHNYCIGNLWFVLLSVLHTNHIVPATTEKHYT